MAASLQAQDPAAERLFRDAQRQEASDSYGALDAYTLLVEQFPDDVLAPKALLRVVALRRADRAPQRTELALDNLIDHYGRSPEAATAYLIRGEILTSVAQSTSDLEAAHAALRRVPLLFGRESFPDLPARAEARYRSGVLARQLGDDDGAAADFLAVMEDEPPGPFSLPAHLAFGRLLLDRGAWPAAADVLQRLVDLDGVDLDGVDQDGGTSAVPEARIAGQWLSLLHRRIVKPLAGQRLFESERAFGAGFALEKPTGIAAHRDGRVAVTDPGQQAFAVLGPDGTIQVRATIRGLSAPFWDDDDATAISGESLVQPFGGRTITLSAPDRDSALKGMQAVARGGLGQYFVAAKGEDGVLRYAGRRHAGTLWARSRYEATDLASDDRGRVYVLDRRAGEIRRVDANGTDTAVIVRDDWKRPEALAVDALGYLFVADRGLGEVRMYDPSGNRVTTLGPTLDNGTQLKAPIDVAVDGQGRLFILDARLASLVVLE